MPIKADALFSSASVEWETPPEIFAEYDRKYHFTLDVAATKENALCSRYYTKETDGLSRPWQTDGAVWCNPPYGKDIVKWVRKAYEESRKGQTIVMLVPARTDTRWFHDFILGKAEVRFIRGRLYFKVNGVKQDRAPFPSIIVIYNGGEDYAE